MNTVVFAIHTVPDTETGARKYNLGDLEEKNAIKAMMHLQQQSGTEELPHFMQRIAAISTVSQREKGELAIKTYSGSNQSEAEMLKQFFNSFGENPVRFVSWDTVANDLPVLMYRCLKNKVSVVSLNANAPLSLKNELSCHQPTAMTTQKNVMDMLGLDYASVLSIKEIWQHWRKGKYAAIQQSCTNRALDSYKIFLHYQLVMGEMSYLDYEREMIKVT